MTLDTKLRIDVDVLVAMLRQSNRVCFDVTSGIPTDAQLASVGIENGGRVVVLEFDRPFPEVRLTGLSI